MKHTDYTPGPWTGGRAWENGSRRVVDICAGPRVVARAFGDSDAEAYRLAALIADTPRLAEENEKLRAALILAQAEAEITLAGGAVDWSIAVERNNAALAEKP